MNATHLDELSPDDLAFARVAALRLRASETLDYVESAKLAATRAQLRALVAKPQPLLPVWAWVAAPAVFALVVFSALRLSPETAPHGPQPTTEVLVSLAADVNASTSAALNWQPDEAGPDFYRDLEFYQWLQQQRSPTEPNA